MTLTLPRPTLPWNKPKELDYYPPKPHYKPDDLPSTLIGRVTKEDLKNAEHGDVLRTCALATALKRQFPGIEHGNFAVGYTHADIGNRRFFAENHDEVGIGVRAWLYDRLEHNAHEFNYVLKER